MSLGFLDRLRHRNAPAMQREVDGPSQVRAYWEGLRNAGAVPARAALDPRGFGGVLDRVFLAERIGQGLAQVKIAGSALTDLAGTELRGLPLSCLFTPESRPVLALALEGAFAGAEVADIELGSDRNRMGMAIARLVLLPLAKEGECRQVLGVIGFAESLPTCKLQVLARRTERLVLSEPPTSLSPPASEPPVTAGRQGHLRLVHFDT